MLVSSKSFSLIARFITGDIVQTPYLTGEQLVELFNEHGFADVYEYGNNTFPACWKYVEQKLEIINVSDNLKAVLEDLIDDTPEQCWGIINKGVPKKPSRERGRNQ